MMNDLFQRGEAHAKFTQENALTARASRFYPCNRSTVRSSFNNFKKGERGNGSWACYKSIPIENLKFLEIASLDKFFDHTGTRPGIWFRKMRFSATRYSFRNNSSWSTVPVI